MRTQGRLMIPVISLLMMLAGGVGILGQDKPAPPSRHDAFSMGVAVGTQDRGSRPIKASGAVSAPANKFQSPLPVRPGRPALSGYREWRARNGHRRF